MDDPYVCLTSKYFKHFTGIAPVFFDPGDPDSPTLSARDIAIRNYVFNLGKSLKQDGDLRKIILEIISTNLYLNPEASSIK